MFIHLLTQKTEIQRQQQCHLPASVSVVTPPSKSLQPARKVKPKSRKRSPPQSDSSLLAQHTMIITGPDDFIKDNGRTSGGPLKKTRPSSLDTTLQVPPPSPPCSSTCSSPLLSSNHSLSSLSTSSLPMLDDEENRPFLMMDPLALIDHSPDPLTKYMSQDVALFSPNSPTLFTPWPTPIYASPFLEIEATTLPLVQPSWPKSTPPHDDDPSCFIHMDDYLANGMYTEFDQFFSFNH
ncbi:hypothetical protein DM01DRAFT_1120876 [Hesseltinella vesiculosa]|uniref:Uncharacterized protein n=1 Tax=Hesseltinella vesiculosa TaxID=101127 RepID=A0A1X2GTQ9_9FUNG|nr:hypothetical protein DM01DRAFT_1120876 [Hesseltinella vesiculosa]